MAIGVGSIVSPRLRGALLVAGAVSPNPTYFGNVQASGEGGIDVLWMDGRLAEGIEAAALDEITNATAGVVAQWRGQVVTVAGQTNSARMVVMDVFVRDVDSANTVMASCKLVNVDSWHELPVTALAIVPGAG